MTVATASTALRQIGRRASQLTVAPLSGLDQREIAAVTRELTSVPRGARVDVALLVADVRDRQRARAEAEAARRRADADPWHYELLLKAPEQLAALRDELKRRVDAGEGDRPFRPGSPGATIMARLGDIRTRLGAHAEPDELDDEAADDDPKPRRQVARRRLRKKAQDADLPPVADHVPAVAEVRPERPRSGPHGPRKSPARPLLFGRAFVDGEEIGEPAFDPPMRPPWLIDQPDQETTAA